VIEVGCWAHGRRYFHKALGSDPVRAEHALALIRGLYRVERSIGTAPRKKREEARRQKSRPIVDAFFAWCDEQAALVLDATPISKAIGYARNQRAALSRFLEDGRLPLDNNVSEQHLRRQVLGRKNWLFAGSAEGGRAIAAWLSVIQSARLHEVEPFAYVSDVLMKLAAYRDMPAERKAVDGEALLRGLLPEQWIRANPTARLALAR